MSFSNPHPSLQPAEANGMDLRISDTIAADALVDGEDPLNHFGMMGWCGRNVEGFAPLPPAEKHSLASQLQVKVALLQKEQSDRETDEHAEEGGVKLEDVTDGEVMTNATAEDRAAPFRKEKKERAPVVNHVTESIDDIVSRVLQDDLDLDRPNHSLLVWAWCVSNVSGFVESHQKIRKEISQAVDERLFGVTEGITEEEPPPNNEPASPRSRAKRKKEKKKEKWPSQVKEPAEKIADRFPCQQLDYSNVNRITAWCILHVDGFADSGVVTRHQISKRVQEVLEGRYGSYEGGVGD